MPPGSPRARISGLLGTVGHTPLVRLERLLDRADVSVWAKLEGANPGGSAKDRTASALVDAALRGGLLRPGHGTLVESSSGNLGIGLARLAAWHGWTFHCVTDPRANRLTVAAIKALGGIIHPVTDPDAGTGEWLPARIARVGELLAELPGAISLDQYGNPAALDAHDHGTMAEIVEELGAPPDWLFVAVSTTGTIGGCLRHLDRLGAPTHTVAVDALGSVLFGGEVGPRTLTGFGAGIVPDLALGASPTEVARVRDAASIRGCRLMARREGILAGASGGAVVAALLERADALPPGSDVVLVLHDTGQAYLDTVYDDDWVRETLGEDADAALDLGEGTP
ncbi:pyridoxal-phosphate dependent enzyme [Propioniciclava sinopodophylli]|uniref:pyridoxal-phosphate dependent enzyme n=1 Tax=Propioniciclava sinopodophylli TaxID=1837344 RepID=UPI0024918CC9|nr:pyridoxal-phosphate dependent enzyme [Propioniciclava sinopodophylli]